MSKSLLQRFYLSFLVSVSFFGLFLVTLSTVFPLPNQQDFPWRKPLIGSVFGLIGLLGMIAVFFPSYCSTIFKAGNTEKRNHVFHIERNAAFHKATTIFGLKVTHGHHPSCEGFASHEFQVGKRTFCIACGGLLLGAFIALLGAVAYFFRGWNIGENASLFLFSGVLSVSLGLFQYMFFDI